jgi:hypothetical protein
MHSRRLGFKELARMAVSFLYLDEVIHRQNENRPQDSEQSHCLQLSLLSPIRVEESFLMEHSPQSPIDLSWAGPGWQRSSTGTQSSLKHPQPALNSLSGSHSAVWLKIASCARNGTSRVGSEPKSVS